MRQLTLPISYCPFYYFQGSAVSKLANPALPAVCTQGLRVRSQIKLCLTYSRRSYAFLRYLGLPLHWLRLIDIPWRSQWRNYSGSQVEPNRLKKNIIDIPLISFLLVRSRTSLIFWRKKISVIVGNLKRDASLKGVANAEILLKMGGVAPTIGRRLLLIKGE